MKLGSLIAAYSANTATSKLTKHFNYINKTDRFYNIKIYTLIMICMHQNLKNTLQLELNESYHF